MKFFGSDSSVSSATTLTGNADINKDNKITNGELLSYMDDKISIQASSLGREQNPSLTGDPDKVLVSFN